MNKDTEDRDNGQDKPRNIVDLKQYRIDAKIAKILERLIARLDLRG